MGGPGRPALRAYDDLIGTMQEEGITCKEIAARLGLKCTQVQSVVRRLNREAEQKHDTIGRLVTVLFRRKALCVMIERGLNEGYIVTAEWQKDSISGIEQPSVTAALKDVVE